MNKKSWPVLILLALCVAFERWIIHPHHAEFWWDDSPGFYAALGLLGVLGLMILAKWLGKYWLYRKEDYYSRS